MEKKRVSLCQSCFRINSVGDREVARVSCWSVTAILDGGQGHAAYRPKDLCPVPASGGDLSQGYRIAARKHNCQSMARQGYLTGGVNGLFFACRGSALRTPRVLKE